MVNCFALGFSIGCVVTLCILVGVFVIALALRKWRNADRVSADRYGRLPATAANTFDVYNPKAVAVSPSSFVVDDVDDDGVGVSIDLALHPQITPQAFEERWISFTAEVSLSLELVSPDVAVEDILAAARVYCLASGVVKGNQLKSYYYAEERVSGELFLIEVFVITTSGDMTATIRCEHSSRLSAFESHIHTTLDRHCK